MSVDIQEKAEQILVDGFCILQESVSYICY